MKAYLWISSGECFKWKIHSLSFFLSLPFEISFFQNSLAVIYLLFCENQIERTFYHLLVYSAFFSITKIWAEKKTKKNVSVWFSNFLFISSFNFFHLKFVKVITRILLLFLFNSDVKFVINVFLRLEIQSMFSISQFVSNFQ